MDDRTMKTIVIIPAFNEERSIGAVMAGVRKNVEADILVIDDASTDQTRRTAENAGADVLSLPYNMGYGIALQSGYKYALKYGYDRLVQIDGDGQHDPAYIMPLLEALDRKGVDLVIGSRFMRMKGYEMPILRRIGVRFFSFINYLLIGHRINDVTSGMWAMNAKVMHLYCSNLFPHKYPDADVILWTCMNMLKIAEIPVQMYGNTKKSMHAGFAHPVKYGLRMIVSMLFMRFLHQTENEVG
jgi:glycosyltransferase involved in cell wall biosynthesis